MSYLVKDSWWNMPTGYSAQYTDCEDGVYWNLYCGDVKVNGGISEDGEQAQEDATLHARRHTNGYTGTPVTYDLDLAWDVLSREKQLRRLRGK